MPLKRKAKNKASNHPPPDVHAGSSRQHPPQAYVSDQSDSEFEPLKRPTKKARLRKLRAHCVEVLEEDDEEPVRGGTASTVEEALMMENEKTKRFLRSHKKQVTLKTSKTQAALAQCREFLDKVHTNETQELAKKVYDLSDPEAAKIPADDMKRYPLFEHTQQVHRISRRILKRHQDADTESHGCKISLPRDTWKEEEQTIKELMGGCREYGEKLAESILVPGAQPVTLEGYSAETSRMAVRIFNNIRQAFKERTWGDTIHGQLKDATRIIDAAKTLHRQVQDARIRRENSEYDVNLDG
ncbi:hypothetical protein QBC46DRAFT_414789 [Diplogelasinospora grovesii]|uniref:Uncharacterized protein n=1 Tax=Diplogelasinospora grovesii TaxID=303347 RepID=A0AAN6SA43_9PEZI|nr:hypothetical protein QBC46DRAFT_414789 [Diplogelasinospora grovesii]